MNFRPRDFSLLWEAYTVKIKLDNSKLQKNYPEGEVSRSKIDGFMAHCFSKLKWAWRAYFLSNAPIFHKNAQLLKMYK